MILSKEKTKILILAHYAFRSEKAEDTDQRIFNNLKNKVKKIVRIIHPLPEFPQNRYSYFTVYESGETREIKRYVIKGSYLLQYLYHIFLTYNFLLREGLIYSLCINWDNLSFITTYPLRALNLIKRLVYYSVDFVPQRFDNLFLNSSYHLADKLACKFSDKNWVMVKEQTLMRKGYKINLSKFTLVPIGYETKNIKVLPLDKIDFYNIVYTGGLRESHGPQMAIQVLPRLIRKYPKIKLTIIGIGKDESKLKALIKKLNVGKFVDFRGFVEDFQELTDILSKKSIGLAPYVPIPGSYSFYSDPSKIKLYMVCGLPVITTPVTTLSREISRTKSGLVVEYSEDAFYKAITFLLDNKKRYKSFKDETIKLSKKFDINNILYNAIKKIPN